MTVPKLIAKMKERLPTGEIFRRIRPRKLVDLLAMHQYELEEKERLAAEAEEKAQAKPAPSGPVPAYHHMHSSIMFDDSPQEKPQPSPAEQIDCPLLLLDVRDEDEFEKCHIYGAQCYPKARLSRATGQFTSEVLSYKGKPEKMIVVYCDYGEISGEAAQMFAERDFDNIFLLHGGLAAFADEFPNLVGPEAPPKPLTPSKKPSSNVSAAGHTATSSAHVRGLKRKPAPAAGARKPWK